MAELAVAGKQHFAASGLLKVHFHLRRCKQLARCGFGWQFHPLCIQCEYQQACRRIGEGTIVVEAAHQRAVPTGVDGNVLLAIHHVGDGATGGHALDRHFPQQVAGVGFIDGDRLTDGALHHQVARCGHGAATASMRMFGAPDFLLRDGIPGQQIALLAFRCLLVQFAPQFGIATPAGPGTAAQREGELVIFGNSVYLIGFLRGNIDKAGIGAERHRVPVVATAEAGAEQYGFAGGESDFVDHGTAGGHVDVRGPGGVGHVMLGAH